MKSLKIYLDGLFTDVPVNAKTQQAKQDLLDLMTDHYHEALAEGKSEGDALGEVIAKFGDIDELLKELGVTPQADPDDAADDDFDAGFSADQDALALEPEEAEGFWAGTERFARNLGMGVALLIACIGITPLAVDHLNGGMGAIVFLGGWGVGAAVIVAASIGYHRMRSVTLAKRNTEEIRQEAAANLADYSTSFTIGLTAGILLCVGAIIAPIVSNSLAPADESLAACLFFLFVAMGVFYITYVSIIRSGYKRLSSFKAEQQHASRTREDAAEPDFSKAAKPSRYVGTAATVHRFYWPVIISIAMIIIILGSNTGSDFLSGVGAMLFIIGGLFERPLFAPYRRKR